MVSESIEGFDVARVEFTKEGTLADAGEVEGALKLAGSSELTDLLVLAHGWNNTMDQAWSLYVDWLKVVRAAATRRHSTDADLKIGVVGVLWPSKQFAEPGATAGGGASFETDFAGLSAHIDSLEGVVAPDVQTALKGAAARLDQDPSARNDFVNIVLSVLSDTRGLDAESHQEIPATMLTSDGELLNRLGDIDIDDLIQATAAPSQGGADYFDGNGTPEGDGTGAAAALPAFIGGAVAGARNLLNYLTYYKMKDRAGIVGRHGLAELLTRVHGAHEALRIHLVGHSFGCRLVTASLLGSQDNVAVSASSMTLLQAAFSHNGFAQRFDDVNDGFFRSVVAPTRHVLGPTMVTHTRNDLAVGLAYPLASFAVGTVASAIGDARDPYGALGSNGAIHTPEAVMETMLGVGQDYPGLTNHAIHNLLADAFIKSHSDVRGAEVGEVIVQAMLASPA